MAKNLYDTRISEYQQRIMDQSPKKSPFSPIPSITPIKPAPPVYERLGGDVAIVILPVPICPECMNQMEVTFMPDLIRLLFRHHQHNTCSRSMTEFIRPVAVFTKFI